MSTRSIQPVVWQRWFVGIAAVGIGLIILVQGRVFLIPLAIALLLFSLMSAARDRIAALRIGSLEMPNWLASLIGIVMVIAAVLTVFRIIAGQIDAVMAAGPSYLARAQQLITSIFAWLDEDVAAGLVAVLEQINLAAYIPVLAGSTGYIVATAILIVLYIGFLFAERASFPGKLAKLFPDVNRAAHVDRIVQSITWNVHRYVLIKTIISVLTGLLVYLVMLLFGLEFAETWALLTVFLNFIPNIGSIVATLFPTLAALVQFDSWTPVLLIFTIITLIQFSVGNLIEPQLMGRSLNLSPFVIILSLTFWGAIWGIVGMFLAVPIMVMVMIACSHVPFLHPIAILLSRDGVPMAVEEPRLRPKK